MAKEKIIYVVHDGRVGYTTHTTMASITRRYPVLTHRILKYGLIKCDMLFKRDHIVIRTVPNK